MPTAHLAIDLGASSGRAIIGVLEGAGTTQNPTTNKQRPTTTNQTPKLTLQELHRFEHLPCPTPFGPVWDLTGIWLHILTGLKKAGCWCRENQIELRSIGVDAWGVDWCLVGKSGELLTLPHCYRDPQNDAACKEVLEQLGGREALYLRNGIQLMSINTLFQVAARFKREPKLFDAASQFLFVPDLFHFWLSGQMKVERTIASTSSMLELTSGDWDRELLQKLNIPNHPFGPIIEPGSKIGTLRQELADSAALNSNIQIISPASHDTAAAVAAVPAIQSGRRWAYLSSGTWSLLGVELDRPFASSESCNVPFTNERGVNQTVRFLKNIGGLWPVQELKREFDQRGQEFSFGEMVKLARAAEPWRTLANPNDSRFASPGEMSKKLQQFAEETGQPQPKSIGELVRCCLESLAFSYRDTVDRLEQILQIKIDDLHIVGGGTQNELLNELTATTLQRPVICGPVEATAIGNLLVQALGCGIVSDQMAMRQIVANSFEVRRYEIDSRYAIDESQFVRYRGLIG